MVPARAPARRAAFGWIRTLAQRARVRARLRRDLERLDHRLLHDMGVRREDLLAEAYRPLWRP